MSNIDVEGILHNLAILPSGRKYCVECKHSAPDQDGRYWCDALVTEKRRAPITCQSMRSNACQGGVLFIRKEQS